jgi:predicted  nucleic acid-binding Zn-ribbon protein
LQDIQNEVASLKRYISNLEDQQIEAMLAVEADQAENERAQADLRKVEGEVSAGHASLRGELQQLSTSVERLMVERKLLEGQVSTENRLLYEKLRKNRKGIAVASVLDDSCSACGAFLTPADRQAARSPDHTFFCPSCSRIVYGG